MYTRRKATTISVAGRLRCYFTDKCRERIIVREKHTNLCLAYSELQRMVNSRQL